MFKWLFGKFSSKDEKVEKLPQGFQQLVEKHPEFEKDIWESGNWRISEYYWKEFEEPAGVWGHHWEHVFRFKDSDFGFVELRNFIEVHDDIYPELSRYLNHKANMLQMTFKKRFDRYKLNLEYNEINFCKSEYTYQGEKTNG